MIKIWYVEMGKGFPKYIGHFFFSGHLFFSQEKAICLMNFFSEFVELYKVWIHSFVNKLHIYMRVWSSKFQLHKLFYISKENILLVRPLYNNPYTLKTDTFFNKIRQPRSTVKRKSPEWGEGLTYKLQIIS